MQFICKAPQRLHLENVISLQRNFHVLSVRSASLQQLWVTSVWWQSRMEPACLQKWLSIPLKQVPGGSGALLHAVSPHLTLSSLKAILSLILWEQTPALHPFFQNSFCSASPKNSSSQIQIRRTAKQTWLWQAGHDKVLGALYYFEYFCGISSLKSVQQPQLRRLLN